MVDFKKINELAPYWCFITDAEGHWYKIPVNKKYEFEKWVQAVESISDLYDYEDFDKYRCMHPVNYMFKEPTTLKEH